MRSPAGAGRPRYAHGGTVWWESRFGEGTTYSFALPIAIPDDYPNARKE